VRVGRARVALALGVLSLGLSGGCGGEEPNEPVDPAPAFGGQPNFVFVLTDDQDASSYTRETMPRTWRLLGREGTSFENHFDATPLCCPSRAAMLTGQYGHNNGVLNNNPGYGDLLDPDNVLPVWLERAGYATAYVGKFLNGYEKAVDDKDEVAPGWQRWSVLVGNGRGYRDFKLTVDGRQRKETYSGEYLTNVLNGRAVDLVDELAAAEQPFFLQLSQLAPHVESVNANSGGPCGGSAVPARRDLGRYAGVGLPRIEGVRERDVSDKPEIVAGQPVIGRTRREALRRQYQCRLETLPAVDRGIAAIVAGLREAGELDETVILFGSDNGTFHGQHRLPGGKGLAYEEAAKVPFVIRVPPRYLGGAQPVARVEEPTSNIDVVPSLVEWAGTETCPEAGKCRVMDGRSLLGLIAGRPNAWPEQRAMLTELDLRKDQVSPGRGISCRYAGVRQGRWLYLRHSALPDLATGECEETEEVELYDHVSDPFELENLAAGSPERASPVAERLATLTDELSDCAGIEGRDPEPESGHYCD